MTAEVRHPASRPLAGMLGRLATGRAAANAGRTGSALFELPAWLWLSPGTDLGRKAAADGPTLFPLPVSWDTGLIVRTAGPAQASWQVASLGRRLSGTVTLDPGSGPATWPDQHMPQATGPTASTAAQAKDRLAWLQADGQAALWDLRQHLTPVAERALRHAAWLVGREVHGDQYPAAIADEEEIVRLVTAMVYGERSDLPSRTPTGLSRPPAPSRIDQIITLALRPSSLARTDLSRYVRDAIRREAESQIRGAIGDPHVGRKVRALAARRAFRSLDELVAEYNRLWPADRLGPSRAMAALLVTLAERRPLVPLGTPVSGHGEHRDPGQDFEDELCERLSRPDDTAADSGQEPAA